MKKQTSFYVPLILFTAIAVIVGRIFYSYLPIIDEKLEPFYKSYHKEEPQEYAIETVGEEEVRNPHDPRFLIAEAKEAIRQNPKEAWKKLEVAVKKNPTDPKLRIYRAKILEGAEKPSLARKEFETALRKNPGDIHLINQYASFLLRQKEYQQAADLIAPYMETHREVASKGIFLDKVVKKLPNSSVPSSPYLLYLTNLEPGTYWDQETFEQLPNSDEILQKNQTTFWLRLLDHLKKGEEGDALVLIENNPFKHESWNPELELNLAKILNYRKNRSFDAQNEETLWIRRRKIEKEHSQVTNNIGNPDLKSLWISPEVFTIALLSNGFGEAAIDFHKVDTYPMNFPEWAEVAYYENLKEHRGEKEAKAFLHQQPGQFSQTPETEEPLEDTEENPES